ncbi:MAG TPA: hypothetical protein DCE44_03335 [Verrucomicrobiales bacterium]|nr:hypothetical protein [Verrucomicrobiales bacterium]
MFVKRVDRPGRSRADPNLVVNDVGDEAKIKSTSARSRQARSEIGQNWWRLGSVSRTKLTWIETRMSPLAGYDLTAGLGPRGVSTPL